MHGMVSLELAESLSPRRGRRPLYHWGKREARILLGGVIAAVALGLAGYVYLTQPRFKKAEHLLPIETWSVWQTLRQGVDWHLSPGYEEFIEELEASHRWLVVHLTVAALGVLLMTLSFMRPKHRTVRISKGSNVSRWTKASKRRAPGAQTVGGARTNIPGAGSVRSRESASGAT
jgi:hypothetical protein